MDSFSFTLGTGVVFLGEVYDMDDDFITATFIIPSTYVFACLCSRILLCIIRSLINIHHLPQSELS